MSLIQFALCFYIRHALNWGADVFFFSPSSDWCETDLHCFRYVGELISDSEADRREDDSYLFDLDNKVSQFVG